MPKNQYYVRVRGKILGPFDLAQMKRQRDRGQLSRFHELSEDRVAWFPASNLEELFPSEEVPQESQPTSSMIATAPSQSAGRKDESHAAGGGSSLAPPLWHYMNKKGQEIGPVTREQLLDRLADGVIDAQTLVWNPSMTGWEPLETVPGLLSRADSIPKRRTGESNLLALASFLAAGLWLGGLASAAAVVLSICALRQMSRRGSKRQGRWMALTGLIAGSAGLALTPILGLIVYFVLREPATLSADQVSARHKDKVYLIKTSRGTGSGILIANSKTRGLIASNMHVFEPELVDEHEARRMMRENAIKKEATAEVKNPSQVHVRTARVAAFHRDNDLALLIIEMDNAVPDAVPIIRKHRLHEGEAAVALGYPLGLDYKATPGAISGASGEEGAVWTTCPINPGNSGGPLFLQRRGLLAGLNTFKRNQVTKVVDDKGKLVGVDVKDTQNLNGAEPAEELVVPIQAGRTDKWVWAPDLKEVVIELAKQVPVRD